MILHIVQRLVCLPKACENAYGYLSMHMRYSAKIERWQLSLIIWNHL